MSEFRFEVGNSYVGTATFDRKHQKVFVVTAREGDCVSFAYNQNVTNTDDVRIREELVGDCDGTETVRIKDDDGFDYVASARVPFATSIRA